MPRIGIEHDPRGRRRRRRGHRRRPGRRDGSASVAAYRDPWKERAEPATPGPVPHLAAADRAAPGAGAGGRDDAVAAVPARRHPARRGPRLRGRRREVAVFRLRDGSRARAVAPSARTAAARSPTGRSTTQVVVCPLHLNAFDLTTGCSLTGADRPAPSIPSASTPTATSSSPRCAASEIRHDHDPARHHSPHAPPTVRGHWIDDWRPEDPTFWDADRRADRPAQPDLLDLLRAHRLLGVDAVVGAGAVPRPGVRHRPGRQVPAHRGADAGRRGAADPVHLRGGPLRRPQLDHLQRRAAARPGGPRRVPDQARRLVHDAAGRWPRSPASAAATSPPR